MPGSNDGRFNYDDNPRPPDSDGRNRGPWRHRAPDRLQLSRQEWATLPADALDLLAPLLSQDPRTWKPETTQAIIASLGRANGTGEAAAVLGRLRHMTTVESDQNRDWAQPIAELRQLYIDEENDRRRPAIGTHTFASRMAEVRVDGEKRRAGAAAAEEERQAWRTNPTDPQAPIEIRAARDRAERDVELRRPQLVATKTREIESDKIKQHNKRCSDRSNQIAGLEKTLKKAGVPLPPKPNESL